MALTSFVRHILGAASFARTKGQDERAVPRGNNPVQGKTAQLKPATDKPKSNPTK
jgi:hypothetical protein